MKKQVLPKGWTHEKIRKVIAHYDNMTDEELAAEDEAAFSDPRMTRMLVPTELVPAIAHLIESRQHKTSNARARRRPARKARAKKA